MWLLFGLTYLTCHTAGAIAQPVPGGNGNVDYSTPRTSLNAGQICVGTASDEEIENYTTALTYQLAEVCVFENRE